MKNNKTSSNLGSIPQERKNKYIGMSKTLHQQIGIKKSVTDMIQKQPSTLHNCSSSAVNVKDQQNFSRVNNLITMYDKTQNNVKQNYIKNIQNKQQIIQKQKEQKIQVQSNQKLQNQQIKIEQSKLNSENIKAVQNDNPQELFYVFFKTKSFELEGNSQQQGKSFLEINKMIQENSDIKFSQIQQIKVECGNQINKLQLLIPKCNNLKSIKIFQKFQTINFSELSKFIQYIQNFENIKEFKLDFSQQLIQLEQYYFFKLLKSHDIFIQTFINQIRNRSLTNNVIELIIQF
ncbi:hypothetical protein TTHERM_00340020 (macronuclear) [Tetrahymena thermophila SB210]|uniref:Uncharacterized protein n=1 Tax=Tetrahymena thermophila (strain SB210) TaxID=312017 RepID=I7LV86_TETTS|nr:hypothetical protein TTHERM_00340020 [Tetrahymena thermophila SB210]EAR97421.2 hypothetical protein TTHERM_00340020 [Tetrahymena thermophila SB210]|eukprot:XP_001017666.2 hypothetical protein TTHERM_00340020 [Tetrahymena thermophila SB210]